MFDLERVQAAVKSAIAEREAEKAKYPQPTFPASNIQDAVAAADEEAMDWGFRWGMQQLLIQLGIDETDAEKIAFVEMEIEGTS